MHSAVEIPVLNTLLWGVRILSAMPALFQSVSGFTEVVKPGSIVEGILQLGYSEGSIVPMRIDLLARTLMYVMQGSSGLGTLLSGYLGGVIAMDVRVGNPLLTHVLLPLYLGVLTWGGLFFREKRPPWLVALRT